LPLSFQDYWPHSLHFLFVSREKNQGIAIDTAHYLADPLYGMKLD